jgi:hypothetical protein
MRICSSRRCTRSAAEVSRKVAQSGLLGFSLFFSHDRGRGADLGRIRAIAAARRVVLAQTLLIFVFNVAIVGLSINVAAGLMATG